MPPITYFICRIYFSSLLQTCESHEKTIIYLAFLALKKRYVLSQICEREYTYVGCMRYEIVIYYILSHSQINNLFYLTNVIAIM